MTKREQEKESKRTEREMRQSAWRQLGERLPERGQRRDRARTEIENRKGKTRETNRNHTYKGASIETG